MNKYQIILSIISKIKNGETVKRPDLLSELFNNNTAKERIWVELTQEQEDTLAYMGEHLMINLDFKDKKLKKKFTAAINTQPWIEGLMPEGGERKIYLMVDDNTFMKLAAMANVLWMEDFLNDNSLEVKDNG